jgi:DNA-binding XRE family transcriptional regulator
MRKQTKIKTVINGQEVTVEQDSQTGQFFTRENLGNIPIDYASVSDRVTIGQCIKYWRVRHGYSQAELAERIGVAGHNVIAMWENGRRKPQKEYRLRLAEHLDRDILTKD